MLAGNLVLDGAHKLEDIGRLPGDRADAGGIKTGRGEKFQIIRGRQHSPTVLDLLHRLAEING